MTRQTPDVHRRPPPPVAAPRGSPRPPFGRCETTPRLMCPVAPARPGPSCCNSRSPTAPTVARASLRRARSFPGQAISHAPEAPTEPGERPRRPVRPLADRRSRGRSIRGRGCALCWGRPPSSRGESIYPPWAVRDRRGEPGPGWRSARVARPTETGPSVAVAVPHTGPACAAPYAAGESALEAAERALGLALGIARWRSIALRASFLPRGPPLARAIRVLDRHPGTCRPSARRAKQMKPRRPNVEATSV